MSKTKQLGEEVMKFVPLGDRVVVAQKDAESKTESGLYIPDNGKRKPLRGNVVAAGPGVIGEDGGIKRPMSLKVGDIVLFANHTWEKIMLDDEEFLLLKESDILGKIVVEYEEL